MSNQLKLVSNDARVLLGRRLRSLDDEGVSGRHAQIVSMAPLLDRGLRALQTVF